MRRHLPADLTTDLPTDLTDTETAQAALRQTLDEVNRLAVAVNSLTSGVVISDPNLPDNPVIFANPGFYSMTGYSPEETLGRNCRFLQGPGTDRSMINELRKAIGDRRQFTGQFVNYRKDGTPFVTELIVSPVIDPQGNLLNFVGLQNDITERVQAEAAVREARRVTEQANRILEQRVEERTSELARSQLEVLVRLARAAEYRDDDTGQHTQRVGRTAALIATAMGLPSDQVSAIGQAAPLHDVGKIAISDQILLKPGKLTDKEFEIMRTHAVVGAELLAGGSSDIIRTAELIAGCHHERWDGNGYPNKLSGEQIPVEAQIVSVADVFDALTHERPYKHAWSPADAVAEIQRMSGHAFNPQVVQAFLTLNHQQLVN